MTEESNKPPMIEAEGLSKFYGIFTACLLTLLREAHQRLVRLARTGAVFVA